MKLSAFVRARDTSGGVNRKCSQEPCCSNSPRISQPYQNRGLFPVRLQVRGVSPPSGYRSASHGFFLSGCWLKERTLFGTRHSLNSGKKARENVQWPLTLPSQTAYVKATHVPLAKTSPTTKTDVSGVGGSVFPSCRRHR